MNNKVFDRVLEANKNYIDALNKNATAYAQTIYLDRCKMLMKELVIEAGLAQEYREYCEKKIATEGKLF